MKHSSQEFDTGGGSGYAALLALIPYGIELGSVTLKINNQQTRNCSERQLKGVNFCLNV
jgi:hypothetical protein